MHDPYRATTVIPPIVQQAQLLARTREFTQSCTDEVGRLLRLLASQVHHGIIGEIGTGCGVGTAWLASALPSDASLITIEIEPDHAAAARSLFAQRPNVTVLTGDWHALLAHGPFSLLFVDGGKAKDRGADEVRTVLALGGLAVIDDLTPLDQWPPEWHGQRDSVRDYWLNHPAVIAVELQTTSTSSVILAHATLPQDR